MLDGRDILLHRVVGEPAVVRALIAQRGDKPALGEPASDRVIEQRREGECGPHTWCPLFVDRASRHRQHATHPRRIRGRQMQRDSGTGALRRHDHRYAGRQLCIEHSRHARRLRAEGVIGTLRSGGRAHAEGIDHERFDPASSELPHHATHGEGGSDGAGQQQHRHVAACDTHRAAVHTQGLGGCNHDAALAPGDGAPGGYAGHGPLTPGQEQPERQQRGATKLSHPVQHWCSAVEGRWHAAAQVAMEKTTEGPFTASARHFLSAS